MNKNRLVYFNGKFVEEKEARVSIYDSALMFGDMVFEMTRSFNKKQFKLREHIERLLIGVKILEIPLKENLEKLLELCEETVKINEPFFDQNDEHRLIINVSRGPLGIYAPIFNNNIEPTLIIADFPLKWTVASMGELFDSGIDLKVSSQRAIPSRYMDPKIKNRSRMWYQMANIEVSRMEGNKNWAIMLDDDGFITEGTGCNFFIVNDKEIISPEGRNILRGISRDYIFELANELGLKCVERNIEPYDVYKCTEAFITATPFCILPVASFNNYKIKEGKMGKITKILLQQWSKNVGINIIDQIKGYQTEVTEYQKSHTSIYQFRK
tara:strand:+ start:373 stop:1350 length:978 start_codon:yes stop_codon:yes gene_type:complete